MMSEYNFNLIEEELNKIIPESKEAKQLTCDLLKLILAHSSREDVTDIIYAPEADKVFVVYENGYERVVNVACDSVIAMIMDILKQGVIY